MSRLCLPTLGTLLTLEEDWTLVLHEERRNEKFANQPLLDLGYSWWPGGSHQPDPDHPGRTKWVENKGSTQEITLPKGTVLKVDRIYIRSKAKDFRDYDSVTFYCNTHVTPAKAKKQGLIRGRFWAKLIDVNSAEVLFDPLTIPIPEYAELQAAEAEGD